MTAPGRSWRAPLFAPGDAARKLEKAAGLGADAVILDLEDAVAPQQKQVARAVVASALRDLSFGESARIVRINSEASGLWQADLDAVLGAAPDAIMLPKVEGAAFVREVSARIAAEESAAGRPSGGVALIALIESARGVVEVASIASADARLCALAFGAEDYSASVGAIRTTEGVEVLYARSAVVAAAAAFGLGALDTPFVDLKDTDRLAHDARFARQLGYTGKLAIHPAQLGALHAAFTPSLAEVEYARRLLEAFRAHETAGAGVFAFEGKMVDLPMLRAAQRVLACG